MKQKTQWAKKNSSFENIFSYLDNGFDYNSINNEREKYFFCRTAMIALKMHKKIIEINPSQNVIEITNSSLIESMPTWTPKLLENGFYIVFPKPYHKLHVLWGGIEDGFLIVCGENINKQIHTGLFVCDFVNQKFNFGNFTDPKYENEEGYYIAKFAITFALMLEAEKNPFDLKVIHQKCSKSVFSCKIFKDVVKISVQKAFEEKQKEYALIHVKGFLRNQACGKNWEERKMIYISPFERMQKINIT